MRKRICFTVLFLILSLVEVGCGDNRHPEDSVQMEGAKAGALNSGYFFEEDGIAVSSKERFLYSDWEPVEFDYICMDPTCTHLTESCSARTIQDEESILNDFCLLYQNRLIILHAYFQLTVNEISETVQEWNYVYQTDVYEADPDGSNRRKKLTFSGSISSSAITYVAVLADGKLYFGGPTKERERIESDAQGQWLTFEWWTSDAIYCLDLNDYTLETYAAMEDKEVKDEEGYQYQFYAYDGMVYGMISNFKGDNAVWYRLDPKAGVCEEILRFDSNVAWFGGAIGDTVYYWYQNSWKTLYARDISAEVEEREIVTVTGENMIVSPFVLDGQLLCMTDCRIEEGNRMAEYTVFDPEGKILDTIRYDDYIIFLDAVGDKILYYKMESDFDYELWWADKEDLKDLMEKGVRIGPLNGSALDRLVD